MPVAPRRPALQRIRPAGDSNYTGNSRRCYISISRKQFLPRDDRALRRNVAAFLLDREPLQGASENAPADYDAQSREE